jgi:hypothetical protein
MLIYRYIQLMYFSLSLWVFTSECLRSSFAGFDFIMAILISLIGFSTSQGEA